MTRFVRDTISAICYEIAREHDFPGGRDSLGQVESFVREQLARMPEPMGFAVQTATAVFGMTACFHGMRLFHRQQVARRALHWTRWKCSSLGPCRDLVRLYESLVILFLYSEAGWDTLGGAGS